MARLYADENFPQPVVESLRAKGHDVLTTQDSGKAGQAIPDDEVLAFAIEEKRIVVTFNRKHFIRLHNENNHHTGIVVCTVDNDFRGLAERIHIELESKLNLDGKLV